ncbi:Transposon Tf2-6 polyprotein [Dictyocoela muelleri]|nr:Transposon Tf2-6 polyprotein [Dictyocoela muelleri]
MSDKTKFLTDKIGKGKKWKWQKNDQDKLNQILEEIRNAPKLKFPDPSKTFILETYASSTALGSVLKQDRQPAGFFSHKLSTSEKNYSNMEREMLAVVKTLEYFKPIIFNSHYIIRSDNNNIMGDSDIISTRLQKWKMLMAEYDYKWEYIEGKKNTATDVISRIFMVSDTIYNSILPNNIQELQLLDTFINKMLEKKQVKKNSKELIVDLKNRIFIPECLKHELILNLHNLLVHPGTRRLYYTLKPYITMKNIKKVI